MLYQTVGLIFRVAVLVDGVIKGRGVFSALYK
jgi:hypothetical protein